MNEGETMNEKEEFEKFQELMNLGLESPNEITNICICVICEIAKMNEKSVGEFKEITEYMVELYGEMDSVKEFLIKKMISDIIEDLFAEDED